MTDMPETLSGEQQLRRKRRKFYTYVALAIVAAFVAGIASGAVGALASRGVLPAWLVWGLWVVMTVIFVWFSRDYFRRIDELDLLDNLWASTIGFYVYVVLFGSWYFFADLGLAPPMNHFIIFFVSFGALSLAYLARRLGFR